jgi:hypothetical protein
VSGRNCVVRRWPAPVFWAACDKPQATVAEGFALRRKARVFPSGYDQPEAIVYRPDRGSGGIALWQDRRRAERECAEDEEVVAVRLRLVVDEP